MILIHGTSLDVQNLPFSDIMNYYIEQNEQFFKIKLKTIATNPVCLGVYLHKDLKDKFEVTPEVKEKLHFFHSDDHLKQLLENGGKEQQVDKQESSSQEEINGGTESESISFGGNSSSVVAKPEAFTTPTPVAEVRKTGSFRLIETEDVDTDPTDIILQIPNALEDKDYLKQQLENKDRIIAQKDAQIREIQKSLEDLYRLQDIQLNEIKSVYDKQISEANKALEEARKKLEQASIPEDLQEFLQFASYAKNYKASLREGYTQEDIRRLGRLKSKIHVFAMASGDSIYTFMKYFSELIDKNPNLLIVDFSNDQYLNTKYKIRANHSSIHLRDKGVDIKSLVKTLNGVQIIPTTFFNDIALLSFDWIDVIKRLNEYADGRPIIFLFNSINSFSVRYTFSKLATIGNAVIFVKCNPVILSSLFADMVFIPHDRFSVVALNYIDIVKKLLEHMATKNHIIAFNDDIKWDKIALKV